MVFKKKSKRGGRRTKRPTVDPAIQPYVAAQYHTQPSHIPLFQEQNPTSSQICTPLPHSVHAEHRADTNLCASIVDDRTSPITEVTIKNQSNQTTVQCSIVPSPTEHCAQSPDIVLGSQNTGLQTKVHKFQTVEPGQYFTGARIIQHASEVNPGRCNPISTQPTPKHIRMQSSVSTDSHPPHIDGDLQRKRPTSEKATNYGGKRRGAGRPRIETKYGTYTCLSHLRDPRPFCTSDYSHMKVADNERLLMNIIEALSCNIEC